MVADLTPLVNRDKFDMDRFLPGLPEKFKIRGKQYGLPQLTTFGTLLFYNKNLFDQAGLKYPPVDWEDRSWTIEKAVDYAQKLTKNPGTSDAVYGLAWGPSMPEMGTWIFGGDAFKKEHYEIGIADTTRIDTPESIAAHEFEQDLRWKYFVWPRPGVDPAAGNFQSGRVGMVVGGGWNFWGYSVIKDFKWAAAAVPWKVTNKNTAYNDFWELSAQSKNRDAAWAFMKHLVSPDVQARYSELTGTPPTTRAALETWYKRYQDLMPRAELEKVTQGAIDPKRSIESPDHTHIDYYRYNPEYQKLIRTPILENKGRPREIIAAGKDAVNTIVKDIYESFKDRVQAQLGAR
jgi:multiple sugar transport system substrate-binding protein